MFHPEETDTNVASSPKNSAVKHRMKKEKKGHHNAGQQHKHIHSQYAHESSAVAMDDDGVDDSALITTQSGRIGGTKPSGSTHTRKTFKVN
jgi:hypothetical protein